MGKKKILSVSLVVAFSAFLFSFYFYKEGFRLDSKIMGQKSLGGYLIPQNANLVTISEDKGNKQNLVFSTNLSKDQVIKFYEDLAILGTKPEFSCVKELVVLEESEDTKLVSVTFCN